jgi:dCTP deaminase
MLSDVEVMRAMKCGDVVISPFDRRQLGPNSYDVRLGRWFYREQEPRSGNTYDPRVCDQTAVVWGIPLFSIDKIVLKPGENILAHTEEFVGGCGEIAAEMHARSSIGRNFLTVCRCAGYGDVGYINRWTMEIQNTSRFYYIVLHVGMRIAQMQFTRLSTPPERNYRGKYQESGSLEELRSRWGPEAMLPRLWSDYEVAEAKERME